MWRIRQSMGKKYAPIARFSGKHSDLLAKSKIKLKKPELSSDTTTNDKAKKREQGRGDEINSEGVKVSGEMEKYQKRAMHATKVGAGANIMLALSKGFIGLSISSTALVADAANSLGDVLSDAVVYYTLSESRKTATPDRPWGRGKIEPLGALSVGGLLLITGLGIGYSAGLACMDSVINPLHHIPITSPGEFIIGDSSSVDLSGTAPAAGNKADLDPTKEATVRRIDNIAGLCISGVSILAKELLFRYTLKAGQKANSAAVIANAWQHRSDVSTSFAVFVGLIGSMAGYPILDPVAGILVAGVIIKQAYVIGLDSLRDLADAPASEKETKELITTCLAVNGVLRVETLRARKSGPYLFVEVVIGVDGSISASAAHRISELARLALLNKHSGRVANAVVNLNPIGSAGLGEQYPTWARDHDFIVAEIKKAVISLDEVDNVSEVQIYYKDDGKISAKVDIVLPSNLTIQQAHTISAKARKTIEKALPGIGSVDVDLELEEGLDEPNK